MLECEDSLLIQPLCTCEQEKTEHCAHGDEVFRRHGRDGFSCIEVAFRLLTRHLHDAIPDRLATVTTTGDTFPSPEATVADATALLRAAHAKPCSFR